MILHGDTVTFDRTTAEIMEEKKQNKLSTATKFDEEQRQHADRLCRREND